jgi:hypothetical protein
MLDAKQPNSRFMLAFVNPETRICLKLEVQIASAF